MYRTNHPCTLPLPLSPLLPRSQCRGWCSYLKCNVHQHYCTIPPPLSPSFISYYLVVQLLPVSHTFVFVYRFRCTEAQKYTSCDKWCSKKPKITWYRIIHICTVENAPSFFSFASYSVVLLFAIVTLSINNCYVLLYATI